MKSKKETYKNKNQTKIVYTFLIQMQNKKQRNFKNLYKNLLPYKTPRIQHLSQLQDP